MTQMSLGLPLMGAAAGTILSLALPSKRGHIVCGMAWAGLSALHAWQYRKKLAQDIKKNGRFLVMTNFPQSKLDFFIRAVEIASSIPGRARLYARPLVGNEALAAQVKKELSRAAGMKSVRTNTTTGSILIEYDPATLRKNPELARMEEYIRTHVKKR
jgi:hypothetical protein